MQRQFRCVVPAGAANAVSLKRDALENHFSPKRVDVTPLLPQNTSDCLMCAFRVPHPRTGRLQTMFQDYEQYPALLCTGLQAEVARTKMINRTTRPSGCIGLLG
jgi:hypothetical protein